MYVISPPPVSYTVTCVWSVPPVSYIVTHVWSVPPPVSYIVTHVCDPPSDSHPSVTAVCYKDSLNLAVGTSTGQVLLYDLRSSRPHLVKDHYYGFPIHSVSFQKGEGLVLSADSRILKIWHEKDVSAWALYYKLVQLSCRTKVKWVWFELSPGSRQKVVQNAANFWLVGSHLIVR